MFVLAACDPPNGPPPPVPPPDDEVTDQQGGQNEIPAEFLADVLGIEYGVEYEFQLFAMNGDLLAIDTFILEPGGRGFVVPAEALAEGQVTLAAKDIRSAEVFEHELFISAVEPEREAVEIEGEMINLNELDAARFIELNPSGTAEGNPFLIIDMEQIIEIQQ